MVQLNDMEHHQFRGQALLITVLVLTIALTVALSLIRRTTVDVQTTGQLEESARAFSAAEAGIEDALKRAEGATNIQIQSANGLATFDSTYDSISGTTALYTYPSETPKGEVATIWLVSHNPVDNSLDEDGAGYCEVGVACTIDVCWQQPVTPADKPAVEIAVLYKHVTSGIYDIERSAYDPDTARTGNKFTRATSVGALGEPCESLYKQTITLPTTDARPLALRLRPYYNKTTFVISPLSGRTLSSQGFEVSSTGKTETGVTRKIVVKKKYDAPASVFDYVLYSTTTVANEAYQPE